ncbi:hypothetical protein HMPREF9137_1455 [Prevotella denticola F0289]|nr:hypothetical protein HMPREF9137_1455 [Prevotella denticola F0289]
MSDNFHVKIFRGRKNKEPHTGYRLLFRFCIPSSPVELIVPVIYKENMKVCMSDLRVFAFCFLYKLLFLVQTQP